MIVVRRPVPGRVRRGVMSTGLLLASLPVAARQPSPPDLADVLREAERVWLCPRHTESHHAGPGRSPVCRRPFEERAVAGRSA